MKISRKNPGLYIGLPIVIIIILTITVVNIIRNIEKPIKIGVILSLTGAGSSLVDLQDSMILAADEVNTRGGINKRKIKLIFEDHETNPETGKKVFRKIEETEKPQLYVGTSSSVTMALAPLAEEYKVVLMGLVTLNPGLTKNRKWVFRYYSSVETEVQPILSIIDFLNIKKVGILYLDDELGRSVYNQLKKDTAFSDITLKPWAFNTSDFDYRDEISALLDSDAIYVIAYSPHILAAFEQMNELQYKGYKLGSSGASTDLVKKKKESQGAYIAASIIYNKNFPFAHEVGNVYFERFKKPLNHHAAVGYDFIKLLAGLLEDKKITRESIRQLLENGFIYPGITGYLELKAGIHDLIFQLHPARIHDGYLEFILD